MLEAYLPDWVKEKMAQKVERAGSKKNPIEVTLDVEALKKVAVLSQIYQSQTV